MCTTSKGAPGEVLAVRLFWDVLADTDELHVTAIETADAPEGPATSRFDDLDLRAPLSFEANGFEFLDANFDGLTDFRLIEFLPAGPNAVFFNVVFVPEDGRYAVAESLNLLTAPEFDGEARTVTSTWRGNAATHGEDVYAWDGMSLVLLERRVSDYAADGTCMRTVFEPDGKILAEDIVFAETPDAFLRQVYEEPCE